MNARLPVLLLTLTAACNVVALDNAGKTVMALGQVTASNTEQQRQLVRRAAIFKQDTINTGNDSSTQMRMIDGGFLSLQQQSEFAVNNYEFDAGSHSGNVSLTLLKGGLRTITGAIKSQNNQYRLTTPVASIGVRGTHYEAELVKGDLYLATWQGDIDVQVTVGAAPMAFALGDDEDYRFAIVRANGDVEFVLKVPDVFAEGHSRILPIPGYKNSPELTASEQSLQGEPLQQLNDTDVTTMLSVNPEFDQSGNTLIDNDVIWGDMVPSSASVVAARSGEVIFDQLLQNSISSSNGSIDNLQMSMTVNFDTARVPTGQLSFDDQIGSWFAVFNGVIGSSALEININFASHGNSLADGSISGIFTNDATQILGDVQLNEQGSSEQAGGTFILAEHP